MKSKHTKENTKIIVGVIIAIIIIIIGIAIYFYIVPKIKKELRIEVGSENIQIEEFFINEKNIENAEILSDINEVNLKEIGEYEVKIKYKNKEHIVKVIVQDTTAPKVEFQNVEQWPNYEINAEDFIKSKEDFSQMKTSFECSEDIKSIGKYSVLVVVEDEYGNKTEKECILNISYVKTMYQLERGEQIDLSKIIYDYENNKNVVNEEEVKEIENSEVGEYILKSKYEEQEYQTKIIIKDTKAPELELKEVSIYPNETIDDINKFIEKVSDASKYEIKQNTQIDYSLENQDIEIEVIDEYGNKIVSTTKLYITKDKEPPVFSGVNNLTVNVNSQVDYKKGIAAKDNKDGNIEFTVDSKAVDLTKAGTYYATYKAKDSAGNEATVKRKIIVKEQVTKVTTKEEAKTTSGEQANDMYSKADAVIAKVTNSSMSQTQKVLALVSYYQNQSNLKYSHTYNENNCGGWTGAANIALTKRTGDCYIHAAVLKLMMNRLGIQNQIVNCTDRSHFWNLIYINGVWRHIDCTPGGHYPVALMKDDQRYQTLQWLHPRDWNRAAYPVAN